MHKAYPLEGLLSAARVTGYNLNAPSPVIWMQYIGLQDKNGNDIYEGDIIVGFFAWGAVSGVVEYDEEIAAFCTKYPDNMTFDGHDMKNFFIAGNIHENPELLDEHP
jgi:uncharacterized phage protein (TIGR01671 family)